MAKFSPLTLLCYNFFLLFLLNIKSMTKVFILCINFMNEKEIVKWNKKTNDKRALNEREMNTMKKKLNTNYWE